MASYNFNCGSFDSLSSENYQGEIEDNISAVDLNDVQEKNREIEQIKSTLLQGRNTTPFADLFEDLHRYIQQEQRSSILPKHVSYNHNVSAIQNGSHQYNGFGPFGTIAQLPSNIPAPVPYPQIQRNHPKVVHQAHISFVPSGNGIIKKITKRKRKRTIFTTNQVEELEKYFSKKPYVTREDRQILVQRLNVADKAVKIWFQNRRLKNKREHYESSSSDTIVEENNLSDYQLNYVESQINEKTDKNGYVTLDDAMMGNLVNIIDSCLGNSNFEQMDESSTECESSPIYEPISPPDSTMEEENSHWQPQEPVESLQRLLDIQNIIY